MTEYITIGGLNELTTVSGTEFLEVEQNGTSNKLSVNNLLAEVINARSGETTLSIRLNNIASSIQLRPILLADTTYYVAATGGSDSNNGLTAGTPFATIQKAVDIVCNLDLMDKQVTIQLVDGAYTEPVILKKYVGSKAPIIKGNTSTPSNTTNTTATGHCFNLIACGPWQIQDIKLSTTTGQLSCIVANSGSTLYISNIEFGTCAETHINIMRGSIFEAVGNYKISGGAKYHIIASQGSIIAIDTKTITILNNPTFSANFALAWVNGVMNTYGTVWTGSAVGNRYYCNSSVIYCGGSSTHFPGTGNGGVDQGGSYQ